MTRHWQAQMTVEVTAYIDAPDDWDDPQGIEELAGNSVNIHTCSTGVRLQLERVNVDDVIEVQEPQP